MSDAGHGVRASGVLRCDHPLERLGIEGGKIVRGSPEGFLLDATGAAVIAGRVNAHTHLYSGLAPLGLPQPAQPPASFVEILEKIWWRLDRALDPASLRASARLYVAEALLAGTTTLVDHHESPGMIEGSLEILADACAELGMRALLCYGATERNRGVAEGRAGLAECRRFALANRRPNVRGLVGLHASFTVSDELVREASALCKELGTVLHVHVAEDEADVADAKLRGFPGPLQRLMQLGALPRGSILAHGVHLSTEEVTDSDYAGLWLVQNPRSNEGNRVGYAQHLSASGRVALGTDGWPADMEVEARALGRLVAAHGDDPTAAARRPAGGLALAGERFGLPFGPLDPGAAADLLVVERHPAGQLRHALVAGEPVVVDGALVRGDLEAIRAEARAQSALLRKRMEAL